MLCTHLKSQWVLNSYLKENSCIFYAIGFFYEKFVKHSYDSLKIEAMTRKNCRCMWNECSFRNELTPLCIPSPSFFQQPMNNLIVICLSPFKTLYFKIIKITFGFIILQLMWRVKSFSNTLKISRPIVHK